MGDLLGRMHGRRVSFDGMDDSIIAWNGKVVFSQFQYFVL